MQRSDRTLAPPYPGHLWYMSRNPPSTSSLLHQHRPPGLNSALWCTQSQWYPNHLELIVTISRTSSSFHLSRSATASSTTPDRPSWACQIVRACSLPRPTQRLHAARQTVTVAVAVAPWCLEGCQSGSASLAYLALYIVLENIRVYRWRVMMKSSLLRQSRPALWQKRCKLQSPWSLPKQIRLYTAIPGMIARSQMPYSVGVVYPCILCINP